MEPDAGADWMFPQSKNGHMPDKSRSRSQAEKFTAPGYNLASTMTMTDNNVIFQSFWHHCKLANSRVVMHSSVNLTSLISCIHYCRLYVLLLSISVKFHKRLKVMEALEMVRSNCILVRLCHPESLRPRSNDLVNSRTNKNTSILVLCKCNNVFIKFILLLIPKD
jgi:hypothetical protein